MIHTTSADRLYFNVKGDVQRPLTSRQKGEDLANSKCES